MSKLIQLRQRIKAIETIKKITHAMRLIAMSSHSRLKHKQDALQSYVTAINQIFSQLYRSTPDWKNSIVHNASQGKHATLVIVVGSQKGLCGTFNTSLFKLLEESYTSQSHDFIAVGQKAIDFITSHHIGKLKHSYEKFSMQRLNTIAHEITHSITHTPTPYHSIIVLSNVGKSFFSQKPIATPLIPLAFETQATTSEYAYSWEQNPHHILDSMLAQYLEAQIYFVLFQSLLAEQAARFVSMDTATRNAHDLLTTTRLEFNKQRQAKITKELTELAGSY